MKDIKTLFISLFIFTLISISFLAYASIESEEISEILESLDSLAQINSTSDSQEDIALNINAILNTNTDKKEELLFKYYVVEAIESYQEVNEALGLNHDNSIYIAVPAVPVLLYATHKAVQLGEGAVRLMTPDRISSTEVELSNLKIAESSFKEAKSNLTKAAANFNKTYSKLKTAQSNFDKAQYHFNKADSAFKTAQSKLKTAQYHFNKADSNFDKAHSDFNVEKIRLENQKRFRFNSLYKAGRLLRGAGLGVITIAGVSAYAVLAGDLVYITFDTFSDMDALKDRYNSDIQDIISS